MKPKREAYKGAFIGIIGFIITLILIVLLNQSCTTARYTQKPYIAYGVYTSVGVTVHQFINLSYTEGRDEYLDSAICEPGDTILIKDYYRPFRARKTYFLKP
jgi:hypothetical protein